MRTIVKLARAVDLMTGANWLAVMLVCVGLQGCEATHDPVIFNHTDAILTVYAQIDGGQERREIAPRQAWWQNKAGRKLSGLRIVGRGGKPTDYDGDFLDVMRANVPHTSELWVIEPVGINLKSVEEAGKLR